MPESSANISATAYVDNPFDTEANTFSCGDPFRLPEALASTPLRPITGGVTLTWRRQDDRLCHPAAASLYRPPLL